MKLIASARAATILPLLMLPLAVASLWLLVAPHVVEPRVLVIVGAVVVAWYLLGGWIAVQRLSQGVTLARQARAARGALAAEPGCAWLVDPDGLVRGQSPQAERSRDRDTGPFGSCRRGVLGGLPLRLRQLRQPADR